MKKNKCRKILCSSPLFRSASVPRLSSFFLFQPFSFFLSALHHPFLFLFVFQRLTSASALLFFSFGSRVPFFSAQKHSFQPKTILSSAQKHFFQPKRFSVFLQPLFSSSFFLLYSFLPLVTTYCPFSAQVFS